MRLAIVGWRGMVGNVLIQRMLEEKDYEHFEIDLFSTSQAGEMSPEIFNRTYKLKDAFDVNELAQADIILTCQGGDYSKQVYPQLRKQKWDGYWVDASSALRMKPESTLILDPVNQSVIEAALNDGKKDFIGANCTVSLLLMAIGGLLEKDLVEWVSTMTYQAISGAGAKQMRELIKQWEHLAKSSHPELLQNEVSILEIENKIQQAYAHKEFPQQDIGAPLGGNLLPWIDSEVDNGQSREEWKAQVEANKILGRTSENEVAIDGTCVRIGSLRCHSQGVTLKLKKDIPLNDIEHMVAEFSPWTEWVPNSKAETLAKLTPVYASGKLTIPVGRVRKMSLGGEFLNLYTVGDQLLWGAAEPLRRFIRMLT